MVKFSSSKASVLYYSSAREASSNLPGHAACPHIHLLHRCVMCGVLGWVILSHVVDTSTSGCGDPISPRTVPCTAPHTQIPARILQQHHRRSDLRITQQHLEVTDGDFINNSMIRERHNIRASHESCSLCFPQSALTHTSNTLPQLKCDMQLNILIIHIIKFNNLIHNRYQNSCEPYLCSHTYSDISQR